MQDLFALNWDRVMAAAASLLAFGYLYNQAYTRAAHAHATEGYVFAWVIFGTLAVLAALAVAVGPAPALVALGLFAAAGLPMAAGEMLRSAEARQHEAETRQRIALRLTRVTGDDPTEDDPLA